VLKPQAEAPTANTATTTSKAEDAAPATDADQKPPTATSDAAEGEKPTPAAETAKAETEAPTTDADATKEAPSAANTDAAASTSSTSDAAATEGNKNPAAGGGGDDGPKKKDDDKPAIPRGFEHFYDKRFAQQADTTPDVAYKGIDTTEEIVSREMRNEMKNRRRRVYALVAAAGALAYIFFFSQKESRIVRAVLNSSWLAPHMSVRAIENAADKAEQRRTLDAIVGGGDKKKSAADAESSGQEEEEAAASATPEMVEQDLALTIKEGTRRVWINLDAHVAKLYDDDGHLLAVTSFIDVRALKQRLSQWRTAVTEKREKPSSQPPQEATENDGAETTPPAAVEYEEVTLHTAPDLLYTVPSHFPFAAIAFLWLLPVLVSVHRSLTMQVRAAGAAASKGPASKQSRFKLQKDVKTQLGDVAGLTEVKHEVTEIVHMLKNPGHYTRLGARVPRGVLIDGPPGVGKTLLAKAVAGEASLPFISCSGSEFDEVYVGVGAKRVRELFATARKHKPCVIFIDEIDTFGRKRRNDRSGSSRATINALLNELDGFTESSEVMVLAATNRADTLDEALTRSGRFDRKISVDLPPHKDRVAIAHVHLKPLNLSPALTIESVAETVATMTPGCSGADIYNVCNEAAITASRLEKDHVDLECFTIAMDRIMIGMEKKARTLSPTERERLAFHEAGKVVLTWFLETADPVLKATIQPRGGRRSGVTKRLPKERFISTQVMLREKMVHSLGGYVAEEHFFQDVSGTAAEDLRRVTNMAQHEVATYGMEPARVGHFGWPDDDGQAVQKPYGAAKADAIDGAVQNITSEVMQRARTLLSQHLDHTRIVAGLLLRNETVTARELWTVLGERPVMTEEFRKYLETAAN